MVDNPNLLKKVGNNKVSDIKFVPVPILSPVYEVYAQQLYTTSLDTIYKLGELVIYLSPFDSVYEFKIYTQISSTKPPIPFSVNSTNSIISLVFKSNTNEVRVPLYTESNSVDVNNGILVFNIKSNLYDSIAKIRQLSSKFYITSKSTLSDVETTIYDGKFELLENTERPQDIRTNITSLQNNTSISTLSDANLPSTSTNVDLKEIPPDTYNVSDIEKAMLKNLDKNQTNQIK